MMKKIAVLFAIFIALAAVPLAFAKGFDDVDTSNWYSEAVTWVSQRGIMGGVSDTQFDPNGKTTRAMIVTVLWRISGEPQSGLNTPFTDVKSDWYTDAVSWAYTNGIVNGTSATEFSPDAELSREAMATVLYRFLKCMKYDFSQVKDNVSFADFENVSEWAKDAVVWAVNDGIIAGFDGNLMPMEGATRAQCATVFKRFCQKYSGILQSDNPFEDEEYRNIEFVDTNLNYRNRYFASKQCDSVLNLRYPAAWRYTLDNGVTFTYNGVVIGKIVLGEVSENNWKTVSEKRTSDGKFETVQYIEKRGSGATLNFRYRYVYRGGDAPFTATFDYKYVNEKTAERLLTASHVESQYSDAQFGVLSQLKHRKTFIILGNSFVSTSRIGDILKEMFTAKGINIMPQWISRGYANVGTYTSDTELMNEIEKGDYGAVFICGLYSDDEIENLKILESACKRSATELIVFPAHNENQATINKVKEEFPHLILLDWKSEVQSFIDTGKDKWDFCVDDSHLHSTPLAGYIGAHMIYRAICSEVPSRNLSRTIEQSFVENKIGQYVKNGTARRINKNDINYFN